jgi:hypothetical protein
MDTNDITSVKALEDKVQKYLNKDKFDINKIYYIIPLITFIFLLILQPFFIKEKKLVNSIKVEKISPKKFFYSWLILTLILFGIFIYNKNKLN